jgi:hypothetical protein
VAELHDHLQKLLCTSETVKHGFGLVGYLDGAVENFLVRAWTLIKVYVRV